MKFGSLFSGIGGMDLGLERAGMECVWQVEVDPFCRKVLRKHWPHVKQYGDIREVSWSEVERPELLCGGFPCQPVSVAGRGLAQEDERWLWPEFLRAIRELRPGHVFVENVPGLLGRGMGVVLGDLAAVGYDAEWDSLPAAAFGAPHLRWRVCIVAYPGRKRDQPGGGSGFLAGSSGTPKGSEEERERGRDAASDCREAVADAHGLRELQPEGCEQKERRRLGDGGQGLADSSRNGLEGNLHPGDGSASEGRIFARGEIARGGGSAGWEQWGAEPDVGRVADGVPSRMDRLRGLGNAVVPQVAEWIGRRIMEASK